MGPPESVQTIFSQYTQHICKIFNFLGFLILWKFGSVSPHKMELQASQAGNSGRDFCLASLDLHFVGHTETNFYSIRNPKKLKILQLGWVCWLKMVCTLSGGPTLPLLQVSLQSEHSKCTIWNGSGFGA